MQGTKAIRVALAALLLVAGTATLSCSKAEAPSYRDLASAEMNFEAAPMAEAKGLVASRAADAPAPSGGEIAPVEGIEAASASEARERKLVRRAWLQVRVADTGKAEAAVLSTLARLGGYAASARADEYSRSLTLRVPAASLDSLLAAIEPLGTVLSRSENAEDVTLRFYDLEGRLETKRELLATFRGYLSRTRDIKELLDVEARIAELQNEIDWMGSELKGLADLVDYATVDLELVPPPSVSKAYEPGLGERVGEVFRAFSGFLASLAVFLVGLVVYGAPVTLVVALLWWLLLGKVGLLRKLWRLASGPARERGRKSGSAEAPPPGSAS